MRVVGSPIVNGDMYRAHQAVGNLLSNALKFTPRGGHVRVDLASDGKHATLIVQDSGRGIRADLQPFIFDRFRQGDSTTTREHSGLGLGLAIVRHIVELHGGTVTVASAGENQGATFTVVWPVLESDIARGTVQSDRRSAASSGALSGTLVLLVDDDADSREMMTFALEQHGAIVSAVANTSEALANVKQHRPDVIVTDLQMPNGSGFDLMKELRALDGGGQTVPVLAVTAHARAEDARSALAAGFAAYLTKPIDVVEMINVLGAAAGRS